MIKRFIRSLFNLDVIDGLNRTIDVYKERNEQLEAEVEKLKGYKLKYEVTKLYVDDDEALLELFDIAKKNEASHNRLHSDSQRQMAAMQGFGGSYGSSGGLVLQARSGY